MAGEESFRASGGESEQIKTGSREKIPDPWEFSHECGQESRSEAEFYLVMRIYEPETPVEHGRLVFFQQFFEQLYRGAGLFY